MLSTDSFATRIALGNSSYGTIRMPFEFVIDSSAGVIRETWSGRIVIDELKQSCLQEWAHHDYRPRMKLLSDFRSATNGLDPAAAVQFAMWFGDRDPPSRHAIVVGRESGFGFAKMFGLLIDAAKQGGDATRVFYSFQDADDWLNGHSDHR